MKIQVPILYTRLLFVILCHGVQEGQKWWHATELTTVSMELQSAEKYEWCLQWNP